MFIRNYLESESVRLCSLNLSVLVFLKKRSRVLSELRNLRCSSYMMMSEYCAPGASGSLLVLTPFTRTEPSRIRAAVTLIL